METGLAESVARDEDHSTQEQPKTTSSFEFLVLSFELQAKTIQNSIPPLRPSLFVVNSKLKTQNSKLPLRPSLFVVNSKPKTQNSESSFEFLVLSFELQAKTTQNAKLPLRPSLFAVNSKLKTQNSKLPFLPLC